MPASNTPTARTRRAIVVSGAATLAVLAWLGATRPADPVAAALKEVRAPATAQVSPQAPTAPPQQASENPSESNVAGITMPSYPGASAVPMGELEVNGNRSEMRAFQTSDDPEKVLEFYEDAFASEGHRVERHGDDRVSMASFYDEKSGNLVSVMVMHDRSGNATLAFPAVTDVSEGVQIGVAGPKELPSPPGALTVLAVRDSAAMTPSKTYSQIQDGNPPDVAGFYRNEMKKGGFQLVMDRSRPEAVLLIFEKPGRRVQISLSPLAEWHDPPQSMAAIIVEDTT